MNANAAFSHTRRRRPSELTVGRPNHLTYEQVFICYRSDTPCASPFSASDERVVPLADLFRLLGDPTRLRIVLACVDEQRAVGAIAESLGLSPSLVSHHLRLLRAARIVRAERQGKQVFYLAADRHISGMLGELLEHVAEPQTDFQTGQRVNGHAYARMRHDHEHAHDRRARLTRTKPRPIGLTAPRPAISTITITRRWRATAAPSRSPSR